RPRRGACGRRRAVQPPERHGGVREVLQGNARAAVRVPRPRDRCDPRGADQVRVDRRWQAAHAVSRGGPAVRLEGGARKGYRHAGVQGGGCGLGELRHGRRHGVDRAEDQLGRRCASRFSPRGRVVAGTPTNSAARWPRGGTRGACCRTKGGCHGSAGRGARAPSRGRGVGAAARCSAGRRPTRTAVRIAILAARQGGGWHTDQLCRALAARGHEGRVLPYEGLVSRFGGTGPAFTVAGEDLTSCGAVLARIIPAGSLEQIIVRGDALHALEERGIPVINSPRAIGRTVDELWTTALLAHAGLPVPETVVCEHPDEAMAAFRALGDVIVKPLFGSMGLGMVRVSDEEMAFRVFRT